MKAEFLHAWNGYKKYAWGHDDLDPVSRKPRDWYPPEVIYMTPVDALDTLRLAPGESAITLSRAIAGFKWNVSDTLVLGAHVAIDPVEWLDLPLGLANESQALRVGA
mgnify:CR=1 FL=1